MANRSAGHGPKTDHLKLALGFCEDFYAELTSIEARTLRLTGPDPTNDLQFTRNLFAFVCIFRAARDYIYGLVARTPCEVQVRASLRNDAAIAFHVELADRGLHTRLITNARIYYRGGDRDGQRRYNYATSELEPEARVLYDQLQPSDPNKSFTAVEIARKGLDALIVVDRSAQVQGAY